MEIKLLKEGYKQNEELVKDFLTNNIDFTADYFSNEHITLDRAPDFPIYMAKGAFIDRNNDFYEAVRVIQDAYIDLPREIHMSEIFWHSLLMTKQQYIFEKYGDYLNSEADFKNIVLKDFDWENYIYKSIFIAEYVQDFATEGEYSEDYLINLILDNLDMYNYILKYPLFRNSQFIIKYFIAIDQMNITNLMKAKVKDPINAKDERYGRLVFTQFNNNYPVIMAPFLEIDEIKEEIKKALKQIMKPEEWGEYFGK